MCINVGIDLDGITANFSKRFSEECRALYGEDLPLISDHSAIKSWDWAQWYPLTRKQIAHVWDAIDRQDNFWESLEILNEVNWKALQQLQDMEEVNVYFITSRPKTAGRSVARQSVNWLSAHGWRNPQVIVTENKADFASLLQLRHFIDDNSYNCVTVKNENPYCRVYIPDYPYNRDVAQSNIKRLSHPFLPAFVGEVMKNFSTEEEFQLELV